MVADILLLIAGVVFHSLTFLLLARFFMQWQRASFHNQIGHFVIAATDWIVRPLRRLLPGMFGFDLASLLPAWVLQAGYAAIECARLGITGSDIGELMLGLLALATLGVVRIATYLLVAVVLISALFSWVNPRAPAAPFFHSLSAPLLRPFRRLIPPIGNVDISPLILLLALQIVWLILERMKGSVFAWLAGL